MIPNELHRLIAAPEIVVVNLVDHALCALGRALLAEHPLLDDELHAHDDAPVQARARALLRHGRRYRAEVDVVFRELRADDPF